GLHTEGKPEGRAWVAAEHLEGSAQDHTERQRSQRDEPWLRRGGPGADRRSLTRLRLGVLRCGWLRRPVRIGGGSARRNERTIGRAGCSGEYRWLPVLLFAHAHPFAAFVRGRTS